jgi:mannose/fructose/N-acetylgalactosamine-specific phosphotransferase system component IIB
MALIFVRTDDRFIHGQVTTGWARKAGANKIILVNDGIAGDQLIQKLQKMSAGPGVEVLFLTFNEAETIIQGNGLNGDRSFLLVESPSDLWRLVEAGLEIDEVNLGNLRYEPGREKLTKWMFVDKRQIKALKEMDARGIRLTAQWVIGQESVNVNDWLKKNA